MYNCGHPCPNQQMSRRRPCNLVASGGKQHQAGTRLRRRQGNKSMLSHAPSTTQVPSGHIPRPGLIRPTPVRVRGATGCWSSFGASVGGGPPRARLRPGTWGTTRLPRQQSAPPGLPAAGRLAPSGPRQPHPPHHQFLRKPVISSASHPASGFPRSRPKSIHRSANIISVQWRYAAVSQCLDFRDVVHYDCESLA